MDKIAAAKNLIDLLNTLHSADLKPVAVYGTLLGFIRENDFISHDDDIDLALLEDEREVIYGLNESILNKGFIKMREDEDLISYIRDEIYIDIYFFKRKYNYYYNHGQYVKRHYLDVTKSIAIGDINVHVPVASEEFLESHYGKDWKIPKKGVPGKSTDTFVGILKRIARKYILFKDH